MVSSTMVSKNLVPMGFTTSHILIFDGYAKARVSVYEHLRYYWGQCIVHHIDSKAIFFSLGMEVSP